ncbi:hypothetical protein CLUG_05886 [Clavispora lusitaniae ATCC 42720]|uniref:Uncharacterized protein n=1 Tax=Clavispora lusitaniae (strain ATCC 42720) TaxID=306902 RepID=C4YC69_CLAL4|nr:uncharacterized protein CLUG_05886 [Clavispora lusitaniae ATCC 42720]EEQ41757.1 hypothetical protein CLUG_05886 [Clavispora lusitaniae ATCC 42720]
MCGLTGRVSESKLKKLFDSIISAKDVSPSRVEENAINNLPQAFVMLTSIEVMIADICFSSPTFKVFSFVIIRIRKRKMIMSSLSCSKFTSTKSSMDLENISTCESNVFKTFRRNLPKVSCNFSLLKEPHEPLTPSRSVNSRSKLLNIFLGTSSSDNFKRFKKWSVFRNH